MPGIEWSDQAASHMWASHKIAPAEATEAASDLDRAVFSPDPASKSGETDRVIGYSTARQQILCVILLRKDGGYSGINAWPANSTYRRIYREGTS